MTTQVPVRLTDSDLAALDTAIERGSFANRSEALRAGLEHVLRQERERELVELYRRAYAEQPEEDWVGEWGAALFSAFVKAEASG